MHSQEIRTALGKLQAEPDAEEAWAALKSAVDAEDGELSREDFMKLAEAASDEHARRGEWQAVSNLLEIAGGVAQGTPREADLAMAQAKVLADELYDDEGAAICYLKVLELRPGDGAASGAIDESESKRARYQELVSGYLTEAEAASDDVYRSSMLMRAAEMEVRFAGEGNSLDQATDRLEQAVRLDPSNGRAGRLLEHVHRRKGRWEELGRVLERLADRGEVQGERIAAGIRLARVYAGRLGDPERAARAYDRVLREDPSLKEAKQYLSDLYSSEERWADLVGLYERELGSTNLPDAERLGDMLQIGMLHWKKLERAQDADAWFERVRKVDPANEGMLAFFREYCRDLDDDSRLIEVLQGAQRAVKDDPKERARLAQEIAKLAESQQNAQQAIEQYKSVLRQDPDNADARLRLKTLYKQTQSYGPLVEQLRGELERAPAEDLQKRLEILREVATVYRQYQRSDAALLSVLSQIVQLDDKLDEQDVEELREIVSLYEKMGRHRELITNQMKLAEVTPDIEEKKALYRNAGRRWLEQFSNAQNATDAYAKLLELSPADTEARERLDELYRKRRAWGNLFDLYASELEGAEGTQRVTLLREMAQLAQERLNRPAEAISLYKQILALDPGRTDVLDAMEKHAERSKDWATLAEALERRVELSDDPAAKLASLQKLGTVYADHASDPAGAARTWRRVLELQPGHNRALRVLRDAYIQGGDYDGLQELYAAQNDWEGLAEVLSAAADRAKDPKVRIELSYRAADVLEERLGQPDRAFRSYERILAADPGDARAARALIPLYERDEKWSRLPALYELLLEHAASRTEKLELLARLTEIAGGRLGDRRRAAQHARQAYDLSPESPEALDALEQATRLAGTWEGFVEALEVRLRTEPGAPAEPESERQGAEGERRKGKKKRRAAAEAGETPAPPATAPDATERRGIELRLARVYAEELNRVGDAIETYKRLLARDPADAETATALEHILRREDRRDDLRWLLDLRIQAASEGERPRLLAEFATLEEDVFDAPERAATLYRRILDLDPTDKPSLTALPRLLLGMNDSEGAVEIIARHRDQTHGDERARCEVELAELYLERLNQPERALDSALAALDSPSCAARAVAVLESLVRVEAVRSRAAEVLAQRYASGGDARKELDALEVMLAESRNPGERAELFERVADVYEQKLSSYGSALDVVFKAVREFSGDLRFWARADDLAARAGRPTDLAEAYREVLRGELPSDLDVELSERAARLHEDRLGDPIGATPYLERVLAISPGNEPAFRRLKDILTAAERWGELEGLYDRASAATTEPQRRIDMLVEVALVCEEIIEDAPKATQYYERIIEIDPLHEGANRALDRLYVAQGKDSELASLLQRRLETAVGEEVFELKLRLATLQLSLHQPQDAIGHTEDVLRERVGDYDARALAERMLEIGTLRARAARMLESVYEARDEVRDLVRVLEIRMEGLSDEDSPEARSERQELLRRVARLRDERLHDDQGALEVFARLVPLDPVDAQARETLVEIGRRVGAHERVAEVLTVAARNADTPGLRAEILMQVAGIYEEAVGDRERAEQVFRQVLDIDRSDAEFALPAAKALERIYVASRKTTELVEMLRIQVGLESDGETRRELLGRIGDLCETELDDSQGAIGAFKQRLEENPEDDASLQALDRLYQKTERYRDLVDIMTRRADVASDPGLRRGLLLRIGQTLHQKLGAVPEAIDSYQTLVGEFGPDGETLVALETLFQKAERWDELGETYERHADVVESDAERLGLLAKLGDLKREHLSDLPGALDVYRRALSIDSTDSASRGALNQLLESEDQVARREAAQVLRPILEGEAAHDQFLRVLEIELETSDDALERLTGLETALEVAEGPLGDDNRAFGYASRAVRAAAGHTELAPWIERLDRLAGRTGRAQEHVELLCEVVPNIFDGEVQLEVTLKIADAARRELSNRDLAREYYQKALELRSDERRALTALEALYDESGDATSLLDILERRVDVAESDEERKSLMFRQAELLAGNLDDKARAIEAYEAILELGADRRALDALEGLYSAVARWSDLVGLYERQLMEGLGSAGDLRVRIGRVAAVHQGDFARAFDELEQALEGDRLHAGAIAELERLMAEASDVETRARAAALLEPVYLTRADFGRLMEAIRAHLDTATDPDERRELLTRLAKLYEEQKEDYRAALETMAKLLHEDVADTSTVSELERLAKVAGAEERLAEIYADELSEIASDDSNSAQLARRVGELFDGLGQADRALTFYRRALQFEPDSRPLFDAIDAILKRAGRHEERVQLYRDALEHRFEPADRLSALHTIASLERQELARPDAAIETYREALEVDDEDGTSLQALTELYRERERWDDLVDLYQRRAEGAPDAAGATVHRLALARLHMKLGQVERAVDQLEEIVRSEPEQREAIAELEALRADEAQRARVVEILRPLFEASDDWRRQIALNQDRFALAQDDAERVAVLRETADLWERRGQDLSRGFQALREAIRIDPEDAEVRAEYERLAERVGRWDELAEAYEEVLAERPGMASERDILAVLAEVHDRRRDDPRRALLAYERLSATDESDLEPLEKMDALATLLSDWPVLVRVLTAKAELLLEDAERASVWRRVGEAKRDMLEDREGAIQAYERALELEPEGAFTIDCLIDLYEQKKDARRLVDLYQQRVGLADEDDVDLRYQLLTAAARCHEEDLSDSSRAIDVLVDALQIRPGDPAVTVSLNRLYRAEAMWPELLDSLRAQAESAAGAEARAALYVEIGDVLAEKLDSHEDALASYAMALQEAPTDERLLSKVRALGEEREELRLAVADVLVPVLRQAEVWPQLVAALELRLSVETDPEDRVKTLVSEAEVQETRLNSPREAQEALLRALSEKPDAEELHREITRLSEASDGWSRYADALGERASSIFEPDVATDLFVRLGHVAEERLNDPARAVEAYVRAVEQAGDRLDLLSALVRLHDRLKNHAALAEVLERSALVEESDEKQAELYYRLAILQNEQFQEPSRALASLRMVIERAPRHEGAVAELDKLSRLPELFDEAAELLEEVYRSSGQNDLLARLYERRVGFAESIDARIEMRKSLARILEEEAKDTERAQRVIEQGVADAPEDGGLMDELERLAGITGDWAGAAAALAQAVEDHPEIGPEPLVELCVRRADWLKTRAQDLAGAEQALRKALSLDAENDDVLLLLEDLQRGAGEERSLLETLRLRARLQTDGVRREELSRQAKDLADALGDAQTAEAVLRELLAQDDTNLWALDALTLLREMAGDFAETFQLLVRQTELSTDPEGVRGLRWKAASVARDKLGKVEQATELLEQVFEDDPTDAEAAEALRSAYAAAARTQDLAGLLERLIDVMTTPQDRSKLRLELANLNQESFENLDAAIDLLRAVLEEEPGQETAVVRLSELYEKSRRDDDLAELLSTQIEEARARADVSAELAFQVRLGEIYDTRLGDRARAIDTYRGVLDRNPDHRGALEALARLLRDDGRLDQAVTILEQLLAQAPPDEAVGRALELTDLHTEMGSKERAAEALEKGLSVDERNVELRERLRPLYQELERWDGLAALYAREADFAESPERAVQSLREAANIHATRRGDPVAAAEILDRASQLMPDDRELLLELCDHYSASGRGKDAARVLEKIVESYGNKRSKELGEIHRRLANAYLADGETHKALGELDKAFRIEPGNISVLTLLGSVAMKVEDYKKAQQMYRALLLQRLDQAGPIKKSEVFFHLGQIHEALGEAPKALQMYERAVQTDNLPEAKQRLEALKGG